MPVVQLFVSLVFGAQLDEHLCIFTDKMQPNDSILRLGGKCFQALSRIDFLDYLTRLK